MKLLILLFMLFSTSAFAKVSNILLETTEKTAIVYCSIAVNADGAEATRELARKKVYEKVKELEANIEKNGIFCEVLEKVAKDTNFEIDKAMLEDDRPEEDRLRCLEGIYWLTYYRCKAKGNW